MNRSQAKIRSLVEQAMATLKTWRLLRKLRCSTTRITALAQAALTLHQLRHSMKRPRWSAALFGETVRFTARWASPPAGIAHSYNQPEQAAWLAHALVLTVPRMTHAGIGPSSIPAPLVPGRCAIGHQALDISQMDGQAVGDGIHVGVFGLEGGSGVSNGMQRGET